MGDLNIGPNHVWKLTYAELEKAGYYNANVEADEPFCTFCPAENLINDFAANDERIIDHVQVRNAATSNPKRTMEDVVTLTLPNGETMESNLSDHFGYQTTVSYMIGKEYPRNTYEEPPKDNTFMMIAMIVIIVIVLAIIIAVALVLYFCCCKEKKEGEGAKFGKSVEMASKA